MSEYTKLGPGGLCPGLVSRLKGLRSNLVELKDTLEGVKKGLEENKRDRVEVCRYGRDGSKRNR